MYYLALKERLYQNYSTNWRTKSIEQIQEFITKKIITKKKKPETSKKTLISVKFWKGENENESESDLIFYCFFFNLLFLFHETVNFNRFFHTIWKILADILKSSGKSDCLNRNLNSMFLTAIKEREISLTIDSLRNNYSTDYGVIFIFVLKNMK